ncbi:MAG: 4-hydroxy-tetrahydrodipicolinate reductase [Verrucomicrobiales bacterium]
MSPLKLLVTGCRGRMGQAIIQCAQDDPDLEVVATIDMGDELEPALAAADTVIDFSAHAFSAELASACAREGRSLVIGTTGHTSQELETIQQAAETRPVILAPNFSVGVNTLFWLTAKATEILGSGFDLEVLEMHHRLKTDAPSGTAKRLAEILAAARDLDYEKDTRHGRRGDVGARGGNEIGVHALRGGDVVGDHTVVYAGNGERVELTHKASSRNTFANGALRAAKWLRDQPAGLYDMQDVLGLRD